MPITAVIPSYNGGERLLRAIETLEQLPVTRLPEAIHR